MWQPALAALNARQHLQGHLPVGRLPRLKSALAPEADPETVAIAGRLGIGRDNTGAHRIDGEASGSLPLTCERGLHLFDWPLALAFSLRMVYSEYEEQKYLDDEEPLLVVDDRLEIWTMFEDEILLALPIVPRCDDPDCAGYPIGVAGPVPPRPPPGSGGRDEG